MRILHLEDNPDDALLVQLTLAREGVSADILRIHSAEEFRDAVTTGAFDAVVVDNGVPGFNAKAALAFSLQHHAETPVIVCSGAAQPEDVAARLSEGATEYVVKDHLWQLAATLRRIDADSQQPDPVQAEARSELAAQRLLDAAQSLTAAHDLPSILRIACHAARELTDADGATVVLREDSQCYYAEEDAISALWKGQRFALNDCASGWSMANHRSLAIADVQGDPRVSAETYRPTFVRSLAMAPIRTRNPIGAIGNYWASPHTATPEELSLLERLAELTAAAMDNAERSTDLDRRLESRVAELKASRRELAGLYNALSHDLRSPLRSIDALLHSLKEQHGEELDERTVECVDLAQHQVGEVTTSIEHLLRLSRLGQVALHLEHLNLSQMVTEAIARVRAHSPERRVRVRIEQGVYVMGDRSLLGAAIEHLVSNAWKFTQHRLTAELEFGVMSNAVRKPTFYIRDNGVGFDGKHGDQLFQPFQRLHRTDEFPGAGMGLATVLSIVERHGGQIWAEAVEDQGATFYFTLSNATAA